MNPVTPKPHPAPTDRARSVPYGAFKPTAAFSLIELLVAVAVVVILSAVLFSAIRNVRASASFAKEASSLRQIGSAIQLWGNDHDGLTLPQHVSDSGPWEFKNTWTSQLAPYLGHGEPGESYDWMSELFAADWDDDPRIREEGDVAIELSYGYNISLGCRYHNRFGFGGWQPGHRYLRPKRKAELNGQRPIVMVAPRTTPSGNKLGWILQHWIPGYSNVAKATKFDSRGKTQILFTDGSVRTIDRKEAESMGPEHYRVPQ